MFKIASKHMKMTLQQPTSSCMGSTATAVEDSLDPQSSIMEANERSLPSAPFDADKKV
jgi:hypothetical protein